MKALPQADLEKNESLSKARRTIRELQKQISTKLLKISDNVSELGQYLTPKEVKHFLHGACEMDLTEAATYLKVASNLKQSEDVLLNARAQFPLLKALASCDQETRVEALARMSAGATVGTKDVRNIQAHARRSKLSFAESNAKNGSQRAIKVAKRRAADAVKELDSRIAEIIAIAGRVNSRLSPAEREAGKTAVTEQAADTLPLFLEVYGVQPQSLDDITSLPKDSYLGEIALAYAALKFIAHGGLDKAQQSFEGSEEVYNVQMDAIDCLAAVTAAVPPRETHVHASSRPLTHITGPRLMSLELCAGAGGMSLGLEAAGYEPIALYEFDSDAAKTLRLNRPLWDVLETDIRKVDFTKYRENRVDLLAGGLPCQPYSVEGAGLGKDDPRDLLLEGARAVAEVQPVSFVFENVAGLLHAKHADHLGNFLSRLRKSGYSVEIVRMAAQDYGVPQERTRLLIVGMRQKQMGAFRAPPKLPEWRTNLGDALAGLMAENGWNGAEAWAEARRNQVAVRTGVERRGALASTIVGRKGGSRTIEKQRWSLKGINIAGLADYAPTQAEADLAGDAFLPSLTLRMRARLQSFPNWWEFEGRKDSVARQIGNAVPPVVATAIALAVRSAITKTNFSYDAVLQRDPDTMVDEFRRWWCPKVPTLETGDVINMVKLESTAQA